MLPLYLYKMSCIKILLLTVERVQLRVRPVEDGSRDAA